jgi:dipeptidyl-peptidase-4
LKPAWTVIIFLFFLCGLVRAQAKPPASQQLTIENIFAEGGLTGRAPETVKWSPDGKKVSFVQRDDSGEQGALWYVDVATGKKAILVAQEKLSSLAPPISRIKSERAKEWLQRYHVAAYDWAPDSQHLLFDAMGQLWYYSLSSGIAVQMTSAPQPSSDPKFSPDGNRVAYVRQHNVFVRSLGTGGAEKQITAEARDKSKRRKESQQPADDENLLNGEVDWVYAEELDVRSNYFWEPNGKHIAFMQMNEGRVPTYPLTDLLQTHPTVDDEKYPKAGDPNPSVRVGVVDSSGGKIKWISVTKEEDIYIPRFGWVRDGLLYLQVLNRAQNKLDLYFVDAGSGRSRRVLEETSPNWVEVNDNFQVLKSGDRFLWTSWRDGYTHLYLYSFDKSNPIDSDAHLERQLDRGEYEVFSVDGVDDSSGTVYFTANKDALLDRQLYSVKLDGSGVTRVSSDPGTHESSFADQSKNYVDLFSALMVPPSLAVCTVGGGCSKFWQSRSLATYDLIPPKFVNFKAEDGTTLYGTLMLPQHTDRVAPGSLPLILNPYGGPHSQSVVNHWGGAHFLFHQIMLRRGFAVLSVDNRGMGGRGQKFTAALRHHFGDVELKDQRAALDQVLSQYPVLDRNRLGWWGWSYGGYMTAYAMTHSDRFKVGVSVAPVTNWLNYDSIYTERYMGLPDENQEGYRRSSPVNNAADLRGRLLVVHGTGDDNVHFQNTVQFVNALIDAGKQFDLMIYPGKTHGISGTAADTHLFHLIENHFEKYLRPSSTRDGK